jgi:hypothetical protein
MENAQLLLAWSVLAKELQEIAASSGIAFLELLVTQANLDQLGDQISEHFQQFPLLSDSGRFGYVSQRAAFWLRGPLGTTSQFRSDEFTLPEGAVILPPGAAPVLWARDLVSPVLDWRGKPVPESVVFGGGGLFGADPGEIMESDEEVFAYHWSFGFLESPIVIQPGRSAGRPLEPSEAARLLGLPTALPTRFEDESAAGSSQRRAPTNCRARALALLEQSLHLPSLVLALILLAQLRQAGE